MNKQENLRILKDLINSMNFMPVKASRKALKLFFCITFSFLFVNCALIPDNYAISAPEYFSPDSKPQWHDLCDGMKYTTFYDDTAACECQAVIVDLSNPKITLVSSGQLSKTKNKAEESDGYDYLIAENTISFARRNKVLVAINATPFNYPNGRLSSKRSLAGVFIKAGEQLAAMAQKYAALAFEDLSDGTVKAHIIDSQKIENFPPNTSYAFGGFWTLIKNNQIEEFSTKVKDARSAAGTFDNGRKLILLTIANPKAGNHYGATFEETAQILQNLGAENAIMLDGGSSSTLVVQGKKVSHSFLNVPVAVSFGFLYQEEE